MTRKNVSTRRLALLWLAALVLPLFAAVSPAGAATAEPVSASDPATTMTRLFRSAGPFPRTLTINARVRSASGIPTGTVTFYEVGDPTPIDAPVPVDATGRASTTVAVPFGPDYTPVFYRAEFEATGGFADSEGAEGDGGALRVHPEPTVLGIGGPSLLRLPLTTSAYVRRADGVPEEGTIVYFTQYGSATDPGPKVATVCMAITDIDGLATCNGKGAAAAVLSVLGARVWATAVDYPRLSVVEQRLRAIALGR